MKIKVHQLMEDFAYGQTQCDEEIKDGDTLVTDGGVVGFLLGAWPIAVTLYPGDFHTLGVKVSDLSKAYQEAARHAVSVAEKLKLSIHPDML